MSQPRLQFVHNISRSNLIMGSKPSTPISNAEQTPIKEEHETLRVRDKNLESIRNENDEIDDMIRSLSNDSPREVRRKRTSSSKRVCELYVAGCNKFGELGLDLRKEKVSTFSKVELGRRIRFVACGHHHTIIVSGSLQLLK